MKEQLMAFAVSQLGQLSTWRGIVTGLTSVGVFTVTEAQQTAVIGLGLAIHALLSVFFPDRFKQADGR